MLYKADENGIIFCTGRDKAVHKQLQANPAAELCFYNAEQGLQVRIEGAVEMLDDLELKKNIVEAFPFLKPWVESQGYEVMICYRLKNGRAITWTMETNFEPKQYIQLWTKTANLVETSFRWKKEREIIFLSLRQNMSIDAS